MLIWIYKKCSYPRMAKSEWRPRKLSTSRKNWRRMRDLNPRKVALYTLSKRAHSAAMRILHDPANPGQRRRVSVLETMITYRSSVRRHRTELPQDRKVARVGALWRVCGGSLLR